ncbi:MAG TPA: M20/M25/M40 family metallo-hydrolase [Micropepsaceae bacterium]|nr:M20/M25/M40 family metallo-hydrolase [Micropepsaceae bacterium]
MRWIWRNAASVLFGLFALPAAAQTPAIDWKTQQPEILKHYRDLVQIDTRSGHETLAVNYLKQVFEAAGIPAEIFALNPARANLVARIKGNGTKRPLLLLAHTDVVGVQPEKWPVPPFGAVMKDGYVWGRGTADDKDKLTANLMTMLLVKRLGVKLDRDLIFLAESGEEADTEGVGMKFMAEQHFPAIDAEFAITEGGSTIIENGRVTQVDIATTEKLPRRITLVATGTSGHGSVPRLDNPLIHLSQAIAKATAWQTPMRLNETTRTYFEKLAEIASPARAAEYRALFNPATADAAQRYLAEKEPEHYSMLRTSIVPTMLKAGVGQNVIPSQAEAVFDIRALPDENVPMLFQQMAAVIGDPAVKVVPIPNPRETAPPSRLDSEMYKAMERVAHQVYPGAAVIPMMLTGATDMSYLRPRGVQSYGVDAPVTESDEINYGAHSDVERLPEDSLYKLTQFIWNSAFAVAASK